MRTLRVADQCVIIPEMIAAVRVGYDCMRSTVEVLMPMGSDWVVIYAAPSDGIGTYEMNAKNRAEVEHVAELVRVAIDEATP